MTTAAETPTPDSPKTNLRDRWLTIWLPARRGLHAVSALWHKVHASPLGYVLDLAAVASVWMLLSIFLDIRFPLKVSLAMNFLVSLEMGAILGGFALLGRFGIRIRWWAILLLVSSALLTRLFMTADNISYRFLYRPFRVPLDLHLVPDFFTLLYDTSQAQQLAGYTAAFTAAIATSVTLLFACFAFMARALTRERFRRVFTGCFVVVAGLAAYHEFLGGPLLTTREVASRVIQEVVDFTKLPAERKRITQAIGDITRRIGPGERLDKLEGNNFILIFVESYGRTAFELPAHSEILLPRYREMERSLEEHGFHVASNFLTSPTYGGFSWFAHGSLNTGFKVISHLHSQILEELKPPALADFFRDAGYHPINVAPGTTRPWSGMDDHFGIRHHYYSWEFGYHGPRYGFAPMADQFVLDHIHKQEISRSKQPLFVEFALTCSHAPFDDIPKYVRNWSKIGNGAPLHRMPRHRFRVGWDTGENVAEAYATAVEYELDVIQGYLEKYVHDDSIILFLGDHQPHQGVTGSENLNWSVPAHVVSRNPDFVAPFLRRGYIRGMIPTQPLPHVGMERFLEEFLSDFSTEPLAVDPGIWPPAKEWMEREEAKLK